MIGPIQFIAECLIDPDTGHPFQLYAEQEHFLRQGFTPTADGRLPYSELLWSSLKKSGKTTIAAKALLYVITVLGGRCAEGYCVANDLDQSVGRVFKACCRIIEASPMLGREVRMTSTKIEFLSTHSTIEAISSDYRGAAGSNPTFIVFDELWAYTSERARRLWDEMVPVPTREVSARLTVTYAGFTGESLLLEELLRRGLQGVRDPEQPYLYRQDGMLTLHSNEPLAPWQTPKWLAQMRQQLRRNAFVRMIENQFVTAESDFVPMEWWDACVDPDRSPLLTAPCLDVWVGVDASVKKDSTALAACAFDPAGKRVMLVWHRIFQPTREEPLDFEGTIEETLLDLMERFRVKEVRYDPYQMVATAQRLTKAGVPMVEFPQSMPNLTEASQNLFDLIKGRSLIMYRDDALRFAVSHCVAIETSRGWRISKDKASNKIDVVVALAQAALAAVKTGARRPLSQPVAIVRVSTPWVGSAPALDEDERLFFEEMRREGHKSIVNSA
jgi:phage terminase large subunit-like protein